MWTKSRLALAACLSLLAVLVQLVSPAGAGPAAEAAQERRAGVNGLLLFGNWRFGTTGGQHVASVTPPVVGAQGFPLQLSPAGDTFAYVVTKDYRNESLRTFSRDGTDRLVVHMPGQSIGAFAWSPDGLHLAFTVTRYVDGVEESALYRVPASGGTPVQLDPGAQEYTFYMNSTMADLSWSTGGEIAFTGMRCQDECQYSGVEIYTVPAAGGAVQRFTSTDACGPEHFRRPCYDYSSLDWSPDGTRLAATWTASPNGWVGDGTSHVGLVDRGTSTPTALHGIGAPYTSSDTSGDFCCGGFDNATWAPDQTEIAYSFDLVRSRTQAVESYVIAVAGGAPRLVNGSEEVQDWQACPGGRCATWATIEEAAPSRCVPPQPGEPVKKDYLFTHVQGRSRWPIAGAPDARIATFDVGARWCRTAQGPGFRSPLDVDTQVNARWVVQGVLENLGFTLRAEDARVIMDTTTARAKGRVVVAIRPVQVALNVAPVGRVLDKVADRIDDCFRRIGAGVDPGATTRELAEQLRPLAKEVRQEVKKALAKQLDRIPGNNPLVAKLLALKWMQKTDRAAQLMVERVVEKVAVGDVAVDAGGQLAADAFAWAFGDFEYTLWRPQVVIRLTKKGPAAVEERSDMSPGIRDEWTDRTVT